MRKLKFIIILMIIFLLPVKANASTGSVSVSCSPSSAVPGDNVSCTITGNSEDVVGGFSSDFTVSENLTVQSIVKSSKFSYGDYQEGDTKIGLLGAKLTDTFEIATINLKVSETAEIGTEYLKLTSVTLFDSNDEELELLSDVVETTITIKKVSTLSDLKVVGGQITTVGGFRPEVTSYVVMLDSTTTTFSLEATATDSSDVITFYNEYNDELDASNINFNLETGKDSMSIIIKVGDTKYEIIVLKEVAENNNTLSSLTIGDVSVSLSNCKKEAGNSMHCSVTIPASPVAYKVEATLSDPTNFKIDEANGGPGDYGDGPSEIFVMVIPKDSSSGLSSLTYLVTVNRKTSEGMPDVPQNPQTSDIPSFIMSIILIASFVVSIILYKKNIESYQ